LLRISEPIRAGSRTGATLLLAALLAAVPARAQLVPVAQETGANGLALALRRLPVTGRVLYVTAHPDDEHNGVQVRLSRGLGLHVGLLTLTRGEGGQNEIGPELGEALGVLRTEELAAVHRFDGAEQLFGRAYDFGYSFSVDETFKRWGREETLGDIVRALRSFRPDVVLTLPLQAAGGGMHHQAAAQLAREAFRAAADPARFPDQIAGGLRPWQPRKLYQGGVGGGPDALPGEAVVVPTGTYDPLLGSSWQQFGILARAMHRCQGMGQLRAEPLTGEGAYFLVDSQPAVARGDSDLLGGIDVSLHGLFTLVPAGVAIPTSLALELDVLAGHVADAVASFDPRDLGKAVAPLGAALESVSMLRGRIEGSVPEDARFDLDHRLDQKERDILEALALAQGLALEIVSDQGDVAPGESFSVAATIANQGTRLVTLRDLTLAVPRDWTVDRTAGEAGLLRPGKTARFRFQVRVGEGVPPSRPYWHRPKDSDRYALDVPVLEGLPWAPPDVKGVLRYATEGGVAASLEAPAIVRYEGRWVGGEKQKVVNVVPLVSLRVSPEVAVVPLSAVNRRREFRVTTVAGGAGVTSATVRLTAPAGWRVEPRQATVSLGERGQEKVVAFQVLPPPSGGTAEAGLGAVASVGGKEYTEGYRVVAYDHIQERHVFREASARVVPVDVRVGAQVQVGYVMGTGDEVARAIGELGVPVTLLGEADLAAGDLSRFTTIVTGVRAYQVRRDLRAANVRLLRYVEAGGNLVVQYNRLDFNQGAAESPFAPYPGFSITANRVTDETATVRTKSHDTVLETPNLIGPRDWEGWTQERGLQFAEARDPRYADLLASTDPFPLNPGEKTGILVVAAVGKGTWTYTGLSLFRQLPAAVPGAYRLLANLISRPHAR
jgi:LmbE family N-acetylglucosaminyl deacetylase